MNQLHEESNETIVETVTPTEAEVVAPATTTSAPTSKKKMYLIVAFVLVAILIGGAAYYFLVFAQKDVVARVNGEKITQSELDESITLITQAAIANGTDPSDLVAQAEIKSVALDTLVNNKLLLGGAKNAEVEASETDIQAQIDDITAQLGGEEVLKTKMAEVGLTDEKLYNNIRERITVDKYIESATDIESATSTSEEIAAYYESMKTAGNELPPIGEIQSQIGSMLLTQKRQEIVNGLIEKLRSEANIVITE